jgi:hypothetical protein
LIQLEQLCDREDLCPTCDGLFVFGWGDVHCYLTPAWDPDNDGVDNGCENALAAAFAPQLIMMHDCNWDYSVGTPGVGRMGGEYFFAVERKQGQSGFVVRIAYLVSDYWDCGVPVQRIHICRLTSLCDGHTGDSEFIIVDVAYEAASAHWVAQQIFLSAHCLTVADGDCRWWDRSRFSWADGRRYGAPIVWVSEGKHANYYSQAKCDGGGAMGFDTCEFNNGSHVFPVVYSQQNIGSRSTPLRDCAGPFWGSQETNPQALECMWSTTIRSRFDGWQGYASGTAAALYGDLLRLFAEF